MRTLVLGIVLAAPSIGAGERAYPVWDGEESIEQYAKRADLPPVRTLDLGHGVAMEFVLIPAGTFVMGTPEPEPVDKIQFFTQMLIGATILGMSVGVLLTFAVFVILRAKREDHKLQVSLTRLLLVVLIAGAGLMGALHWRYTARDYDRATEEYTEAKSVSDLADLNEMPAHEVTLSRPYYIGKYEVTQEQYQDVMGENPSLSGGQSSLPVVMVTWQDVQRFCKQASERSRETIRLPTEAEWERACRAGTTWRQDDDDAGKSYWRVGGSVWRGNGKTHLVDQGGVNEWGVCGMHGNVWERCQDFYSGYEAEPAVNPRGPGNGDQRVLRGGSWFYPLRPSRSAERVSDLFVAADGNIGFRVVLEPSARSEPPR